ncbi:hypothetical protein NUW58_g4723 [Xylaria curta]|uniref:Uncharacterized protein n=1 Tax=Xylaria curta TaxID=42375 RepID=A0ACC1P695_9PEZI|nr:hypothetical protein NUW58_g4723 [Xylaria curta]
MSFHPRGHPFRPEMSRSASQQSMSAFPHERNAPASFLPMQDSQFDILQWYPRFQSCVRYFLDHAQHDNPVQAMAAYINIQLPFQKSHSPVASSRPSGSSSAMPSSSSAAGKFAIPNQPYMAISLTPYIRRLVATGFDFPGVLHGFFGDDWASGIGHLHKVERRNYLFAAKASSWLDVKSQYDMPDGQTVPFLRPLQDVTEEEIVSAETNWSQWLAMQDWMIGPRNPEDIPPNVKNEEA